MAEGTLPELAVQQIISRDKTLRECQGEDLPKAFDYVQNTADGIDRDSDYPQASNVKGDVLELLSAALLWWPATIKTMQPS